MAFLVSFGHSPISHDCADSLWSTRGASHLWQRNEDQASWQLGVRLAVPNPFFWLWRCLYVGNKNGMPKWCALPDALLYPRKVANSNEDDADLDKEDTGDVPWRSSNHPCRRGCFFSFFLMMGIWILSLWPKPRVVDNLAPIGNHLQSLKKTCFFDWAYPIIIQKMAHIPMLLGPKKNLASLVSGDEHRGHHWHWPCPVEVSYNLFVT